MLPKYIVKCIYRYYCSLTKIKKSVCFWKYKKNIFKMLPKHKILHFLNKDVL